MYVKSKILDLETTLRQNGVHDFQNHWVGLAEATANVTNSTQPYGCWVCTIGPTSVQDGIFLVPKPMNSTGLVAPMFWSDPYNNVFQPKNSVAKVIPQKRMLCIKQIINEGHQVGQESMACKKNITALWPCFLEPK